MKKITMFSLLAFTLFFVLTKVNAQTSTMMNSVFKIQAYSYNTLSNTYVLEQYGSAVLIANNILLTNAHVIMDSNNLLTLQYEACQTISDQKPPKCFSSLQLLKYDKTSDLALLQIVTPTSDMPTPVTIGSGTLSVGDTIRIVGYPANGGETITTTQ
ncbi:MAG: serine protease [bacterium]